MEEEQNIGEMLMRVDQKCIGCLDTGFQLRLLLCSHHLVEWQWNWFDLLLGLSQERGNQEAFLPQEEQGCPL